MNIFHPNGFDLSIEEREGNVRIMLDGFDVTSAVRGLHITLAANEVARFSLDAYLSGLTTTEGGLAALHDASRRSGIPVSIERNAAEPFDVSTFDDPHRKLER